MKVWEDGLIREATEQELREIQNNPLPDNEEAEALKEELRRYDYIGVKIAMGVATKEDYAVEIAHTETLRRRINELEGEM